MIGAFNTVYGALGKIVSRDFWVAVFLPVALFGAVHAAIAAHFGFDIGLAGLWAGTPALAGRAVLLIVAGVLVGFLVQPLMPLFRGLLDGSLLPAWAQSWLLSHRRGALEDAERQRTTSFQGAAALRGFHNGLVDPDGEYVRALNLAEQLAGAPDLARLAAAEAEVAAIADILAGDAIPTPEQLANARTAVLASVALNNPSLVNPKVGPPHPDTARSARTNDVSDRLVDAAEKASRRGEAEHGRLMARFRLSGALREPQPTALGDARFMAEHYALDVYAVPFDFLWPRLLLAVRGDAKDDPCNEAIEAGRARCDFAILCVVLTISIPLVWFAFMLLRGGPGWLFLIIGGATPMALRFFYRMAIEAQIAFAEVVKTTIDRHRFLVLRMLRQPLPSSRDDERAIWVRIQNAEANSVNAFLPYVSPETTRA